MIGKYTEVNRADTNTRISPRALFIFFIHLFYLDFFFLSLLRFASVLACILTVWCM